MLANKPAGLMNNRPQIGLAEPSIGQARAITTIVGVYERSVLTISATLMKVMRRPAMVAARTSLILLMNHS